jgi:putative acetyltransferase
MVTIRKATSDDTEAISAVHAASIRGLAQEDYSDQQIESWTSTDSTDNSDDESPVGDDEQYLIIAEEDDTIAGFGQLSLKDGEIVAVYVRPEHSRQRVGTALLSQLETTARDLDLEEISLSASLPAVPFYNQAGYERVATATHETTGGAELECVEMRKRIAN